MKRDVCRIDFSRGWNEDLLRIKFYGLLDTYCVPFKSEGNLFRLMAKLKTFPPIKSLLREFCRVSMCHEFEFPNGSSKKFCNSDLSSVSGRTN